MSKIFLILTLLLSVHSVNAGYENPKAKVILFIEITQQYRNLTKDYLKNMILENARIIYKKEPDPKKGKIMFDQISSVAAKLTDKDINAYKNNIYELYLKTYSEKELDAMISFYKTDVGQKMVSNSESLKEKMNVLAVNFVTQLETK